MNISISKPDDLITLVDHPETTFNLLVELGSMTISDQHGSFTLTYEEPAPQYEILDSIFTTSDMRDTLDGKEKDEDQAIDYARGVCEDWPTSKVDKLPTYNRFIETVNGIDVFYDFGADYYFYVINKD